MKICSFWACLFGFASLLCYLILLLIFRFVWFQCQRMLAGFSVKLPVLGLFFKFTCLLLQNNLALLLVRRVVQHRVARLKLLRPNFRNLVPNNTCWPQKCPLTLFQDRLDLLQDWDLTILSPVWEIIFFHFLTNWWQTFTKFLYFEGFRLQNFVRILRVSELIWKFSKFFRMPVTCCSCRGSSENCYIT